MKQYILKATGTAAILGLLATGSFAQDIKQDTKVETTTTFRRDNNNDVIIIKPKTDVETKLTIEIKGEDVKINGKPLSEYKSDDVSISTRKQLSVKREIDDDADVFAPAAPRTRFRTYGGAKVYSYDSDDNLANLNGKLNTLGGNKAFLGVGTENAGEGDGVTITSVSKESAAEKAGLKKGDVLTKVNDSKINSPEELTKTIGKFNPDEKVNITYKREKKELKTTATLTKRKLRTTISYAPEAYEFKNFNFDNNNNFSWNTKPRLGLKAQETEDGKGLKVLDVDDESAAAKAGIKEGDVITSFDGTEVNNIDKLRELSKTAIDKGNFKVKLTRDGKEQELDVKIPKNLKSTNL